MDQCSKVTTTPYVRYKKSKRLYGGGVEVPDPECELIVHGNGPLAKISSDSIRDNQITDSVHLQHPDDNGNPLTSDIAAHGDEDGNNVPVVNDIDTFNMP